MADLSPTTVARIRAAVAADDEYRSLRRAERRGQGDRTATLRALKLRDGCMNDLCGPEVRSRMRFLRELLGEVGHA